MNNSEGTAKSKSNYFAKATSASAVIFALVMLFNPNVNIIDILPDFIGYFILAHSFERASDCAPYFAEARSSFIKLGFVSLLKIPALFVAVFARSQNTMDNDIIVLLTLLFTIAEIILVISAVKNIFDALSYLGQRSEASSLINHSMSVDELRNFTMIFLIGKSLLTFIPETLKLTRSVTNDYGSFYATGSIYYSPVVTLAIIIVLTVGIVWLIKMIRYVKSIKAEGKFDEALFSLASETAENEYEGNRKKRSLYTAFALISLSSFLTFRIHFSNYYDVNLLPSVLFGVIFCLGIFGVIKNTGDKKERIFAGVSFGSFAVLSTVAYILSTKFLINYGYSALYLNSNEEAVKLYKSVIIFSLLELISLAGICVCFIFVMNTLFRKELYVSHNSGARNSSTEHIKYLNKKSIIFSILCFIAGLAKFIDVCLHSNIQLIFTNPDDVTMPTILASSLPWFNIVVVLSSVIFAVYTVYYFGFVKDELEDKQERLSRN